MKLDPFYAGVAVGAAVVWAASCAFMIGCKSVPTWSAPDEADITDALRLSQKCDALCLSDGGCPPEVAAGCFESIGCNIGSALHRNGASDLGEGDAGCKP